MVPHRFHSRIDGKVEVPQEVPQWYHIGYTPEFDGKDDQGRLVREVEPSPKRYRKKKLARGRVAGPRKPNSSKKKNQTGAEWEQKEKST